MGGKVINNSIENNEIEKPSGPIERRRMIFDYVLRSGSAQIDELTGYFEVSRMTIHRDLSELEKQGIVRRVHGGVTVQSSNLVESTFLYRSRLKEREKEALSQAAAEMIEPGQAIIIDDSTTVGKMTSQIPSRIPLTVITNSLTAIEQLKDVRGIETIGLGGRYSQRFNAFFGYMCDKAIASLRANILFLSASSVFGGGAYHQNEQVVKTKRALMQVVDKRVLLVDSSKFGTTALIRLADLDEFDFVITDSEISATEAEALRQSGINLRIVDVK